MGAKGGKRKRSKFQWVQTGGGSWGGENERIKQEKGGGRDVSGKKMHHEMKEKNKEEVKQKKSGKDKPRV